MRAKEITTAPNKTGNTSLIHYATSPLKKTLVQDGTPKKEIDQIIQSIRDQYKIFNQPIYAKSILVVVLADYTSRVYGLPLNIQSGVVSDLHKYMLKPLDDHFAIDSSYYLLEIDQKGCKLYEWSIDGLTRLTDSELEKSLITALNIDELEQRSIQNHMINSGGMGHKEGFHGQGGNKDKRKIYLSQYLHHIDARLTSYINNSVKPVILVGSKQITSSFAKLSHHKKSIKGYLRDIPKTSANDFLKSY